MEEEWEEKVSAEGSGDNSAVTIQYHLFVLDTSAKFSILKSETAEMKGNRQNNHLALHEQMSHHIDWDSFVATFMQRFWCQLGVFVGSINKIQ